MGEDRQVGAGQDRVQIGRGGRAAAALARAMGKLGDLIETRADLRFAVEIGVFGDLGAGHGLNEGAGDGMGAVLIGDVKRPGSAVKRA